MSPSRRALWTAKVLASMPRATPLDEYDEIAVPRYIPPLRREFRGIVLGIDSSLRGTGLALVDFSPPAPRLLASRTLNLKPGLPFAACLGEIFRATQDFLSRAPVRHAAIEQTIFVQSRRTVHILGAARGAAIAAVALVGLEVFEYAPLRVKQSVVGHGRASKEQVARMVASHLNFSRPLPSDESDAAATALCHAFTWRG